MRTVKFKKLINVIELRLHSYAHYHHHLILKLQYISFSDFLMFVYVCIMSRKVSLFAFVIFKIHQYLLLH